MTKKHTKAKLIHITIGQDTACYWTGKYFLPEEVFKDEAKLKEQVSAWAMKQLDNDSNTFEPEFDFTNPRVVCATVEGKSVLADIPLGPRYHDGGLALHMAIQRQSLSEFLKAAEECGKDRQSTLNFILAVAEQAQAEIAQL